MKSKILIIGSGFLGSQIGSAALREGFDIIETHFSNGSKLDIRVLDSIEKFVTNTRPDCIINCAALTNIDQIEKNPNEAYDVNAYGAENVSKIANSKKIRLIHLSTDSVFDGIQGLYSENDEPNPLNEYAKSKRLGEKLVKSAMENCVIVRTNFYGNHKEGKSLFNWILKNLKENKRITGFDDVIFNPLEISNLSDMIVELCSNKFIGILHLSSDEVFSKFKFACKIAEKLGYNTDLVVKGSIEESNLFARRPLNTSLANLKVKKILKTKPKFLEYWLDSFSSKNG